MRNASPAPSSQLMLVLVPGATARLTHQQKTILGTLKLRKSKQAEASIDLFNWCAEAVKARDKLAQDVGDLKREHDALQALVTEETAKIDHLARSKLEFEATHDSWLKDLLNEKKVKIRTQEQLLATVNLDPNKLAAATRANRRGTGASRGGKRKAEASDGDLSGGDADKMDVDPDLDEAPESHDEQMVEADRATTHSETESDPEPDTSPNKKLDKKAARASPASAAGSSGKTDKVRHNLRDKKVVSPGESEDEAPPPPKKSPAAKKKTPAPSQVADDDGDHTTASD